MDAVSSAPHTVSATVLQTNAQLLESIMNVDVLGDGESKQQFKITRRDAQLTVL